MSDDVITYVAVHPLVTVVEATTIADLVSIVTVGMPTVSLAVKLSVTVSPAFAYVPVGVLVLLDAIETAVRVGATPSVGVTVVGVTASFPMVSVKVPEFVNVTSGVAPVFIVATVRVITPSVFSAAPVACTPPTVNSLPELFIVVLLIFSLNVASISVVDIVFADSNTGPAPSVDVLEKVASAFPAMSVAFVPVYATVFASVPATSFVLFSVTFIVPSFAVR